MKYLKTLLLSAAVIVSLFGANLLSHSVNHGLIGAVPSNGGFPGIYNATTTDLTIADGFGSALATDKYARLILSPSSTVLSATTGGYLASSTIRVTNTDTAVNMYVATTGTNSGVCTTASSPCLTIQYAIKQAANGINPGAVNINVGAGTYSENLYALEMMGASTTNASSVIGIPKAPSQINIIGDATTPNNVVVQGDDTKLGVFEMENVATNYSLNGFRFRAASSTGNSAFFVNGPKSTLILNNVNSDAVGRFITTGNASHVYLDNGTAGGVHNVMTSGVVVGRESGVYLNAPLTITTFTTGQNMAISVSDKGVLFTGTSASTWNFTSTNCGSGNGFIRPSGADAQVRMFGTGDTVNISCLIGGATALQPVNGGKITLPSAATFNVSSTATFAIADIGPASYLYAPTASTYNMISGTVRAVRVYQGGQSLEANNYGGATITNTNEDADYKYGYDGRYIVNTTTTLDGVVIGGSTPAAGSFTTIAGTTTTLTSAIVLPLGVPGAPAIKSTDDNSGIYFNSSGQDMSFVRNGSNVFSVDATGLDLQNSKNIVATNNSSDIGAYGNAFKNVYASGTTIIFSGIGAPGLTQDLVCWGANGALSHQATTCTVSSERFKEHIKSLSQKDLLGRVMKMRSVEFDYKPEQGGKHDEGFIAEEMAKIDPYLVVWEETTDQSVIDHVRSKYPWAVVKKDGKTLIPRSVAYDHVSVILVGALQAEDDRITALEKKTNILDQTVKFIQSWMGL